MVPLAEIRVYEFVNRGRLSAVMWFGAISSFKIDFINSFNSFI